MTYQLYHDSTRPINPPLQAYSLDYHKGVGLAQLGQYLEAIDHLDRAIMQVTHDHQIWTLRGSVLVHLEEYEEAILSCERAIALCSESAEAWHFRGLALHGLKRYRAAYASYRRAAGVEKEHGLYGLRRLWRGLFHRETPHLTYPSLT